MRWTKSGWFGGVIGGSAWIFVFAVFAWLGASWFLAVSGFVVGAIIVGAGVYLWLNRGRVPYDIAAQLFLLMVCLAAIGILAMANRFPNVTEDPLRQQWYLIFVLFPGLSVLLSRQKPRPRV